MLFAILALAGCSNSSSEKKATVDPSYKGYPNGGLIAVAADLDESGVVVLDARSADAYNAGHIPGALSMPWQQFVDSKTNLKPVSELETLLGAAGIKRDTRMIIYDDTTASWGAAGRLFWMFEYLGCENVRILDGGWDKWTADGNQPETTVNTRKPATFIADVNDSVVVDKEYIADRLNDDDFIVVDTRTDAEFIGWQLYGEARGGHIPGAAHLPYEDYFAADKTMLDYNSMKALFDSKGVTSDKEMVAHCTAGIRSAYAYFVARLMGFEKAANYDGSIWDWAAADADTYPMDKLENYQALVYPAWVKALINGENPPTYPGKGYVIAETGWGPAGDAYNNGHIPEAIWVNTDEIEYDCFNARNDWPVEAGDPPCWDRSTTEEEDAAKGLGPDDTLPRNWWNIYPDVYLLPAIAYMGIDVNTTVVVYGEDPTAAARLVWTLMYAGVKDVRFLDGGKAAWTAAGYDLETIARLRTPVAEFDPDKPGRTTAIHPEYKVDIPYVRNVVNGVETDALLVDIRTRDEYIGATAPYSYIPTSGRIPGAVWGKAGTGTNGMEDYLNADGTLAPEKIYPYWNSIGLTTDKHLCFYCGTGWRASLAWFYAYLLGYPEISVFDSSWFEWSMGEGSAYNGDSPVLNPILDENPDLPETK